MNTNERVLELLRRAVAILEDEIEEQPPSEPRDGTIVLTGRIGRPSFRTTRSGLSLWKAALGVEGDNGATTWIDVQAWRATADLAQEHYRRGDVVTVTGRYMTNTYTNHNGIEQVKEVFTIFGFS